MSADFLDSNILLYITVSGDRRTDRAKALLAGGGQISIQVLNEFAHVSSRKFRRPWSDIRQAIDDFRRFLQVAPITIKDHELGLKLAERYKLSFYDSLIAASALHAGCERLLTEDMHHGLTIEGGLRIENPFLHS